MERIRFELKQNSWLYVFLTMMLALRISVCFVGAKSVHHRGTGMQGLLWVACSMDKPLVFGFLVLEKCTVHVLVMSWGFPVQSTK